MAITAVRSVTSDLSTTVGGTMAQRSGWLGSIPPLRTPKHRRRHHHHHHHRDLDDVLEDSVASAVNGFARGCVICLAACLWFYEVMIWGAIWFCYGAFLGCRWIYRNNILGQTAENIGRRRRPPVDPYGGLGAGPPAQQPVDLADLGDWDGPMRRRS